MNYTEALNILGLTEDCSEKDIKVAYKRAAKKNHPDLGGSEEAMKMVNEAKRTLELWVKDRRPTAQDFTSKSGDTRGGWYQPNQSSQQGAHRGYRPHRGPFADDWEAYNTQHYGPKVNSDSGYNPFWQAQQAWSQQRNRTQTQDYTGNKAKTSSYAEDVQRLNSLLTEKMLDMKSAQLAVKIGKILLILALFALTVIGIAVLPKLDIMDTNKSYYLILTEVTLIAVSIKLLNLLFNTVINKEVTVEKIKLHIKNNSNGTFVIVTYKGEQLGKFLIGAYGYNDREQDILFSWRRLVINGLGIFQVESNSRRKEIICGEQRTCRYFEFSKPWIVIPLDCDETMIVYPGIIIYLSDTEVKVEPMPNTSIDIIADASFMPHSIIDSFMYLKVCVKHSDGLEKDFYTKSNTTEYPNLV